MKEDTEGISSKEDISIGKSEHRKEYFSIVCPTETLPRSDGETQEVRKHIRNLDERERRALNFAKVMSRKAEDLEMQLDAQKLEAEWTVSAVRDFCSSKVFERSTGE